MANTPSAKKATRKIAARTAINKSRRSRVRTFIRKVEESAWPAMRANKAGMMWPPSIVNSRGERLKSRSPGTTFMYLSITPAC